ncbi:MAG: hypothetical protein AAFO91_00135, partial [Bacteroidota bacterium]
MFRSMGIPNRETMSTDNLSGEAFCSMAIFDAPVSDGELTILKDARERLDIIVESPLWLTGRDTERGFYSVYLPVVRHMKHEGIVDLYLLLTEIYVIFLLRSMSNVGLMVTFSLLRQLNELYYNCITTESGEPLKSIEECNDRYIEAKGASRIMGIADWHIMLIKYGIYYDEAERVIQKRFLDSFREKVGRNDAGYLEFLFNGIDKRSEVQK